MAQDGKDAAGFAELFRAARRFGVAERAAIARAPGVSPLKDAETNRRARELMAAAKAMPDVRGAGMRRGITALAEAHSRLAWCGWQYKQSPADREAIAGLLAAASVYSAEMHNRAARRRTGRVLSGVMIN